MGTELELKFQVPEDTLPSLQLELQRRGARSTRLIAHYFDTADGLLARHALSLRLRREGRHWVQTLKGEGDSAVHRTEHNVPLRVASGAQPRPDPRRHDGTAAGAALREALAHAGAPELVERFVTDVWRMACELHAAGAVIEAALDRGTIRSGDRSAPICELELEHKSGERQALFALAKVWSAHGGLWLNTRSKAERGALLASDRAHGMPVKAGTPALSEPMTGAQILRAVMRSALDQVLANASELASGSTDEEHIHQLRIGLRRLRTAMRELGEQAAGLDAAWDGSLSETFARLGTVRDNETVARAVRPLLERAGAPRLEWQMPVARFNPDATVRDARFQSTLIELLDFALRDEAASPATAATHDEALAQVGRRLSKLHRQVVRDGRRFEALPLEQQHRVRKRLKRLRYVAEFIAPLCKGKAVRRYLRRLRPAQEALGTHIDVAVAMQNFRADAEKNPEALFSAGYLQAHLETTARAAQRQLKPIADAPRFWKR